MGPAGRKNGRMTYLKGRIRPTPLVVRSLHEAFTPTVDQSWRMPGKWVGQPDHAHRRGASGHYGKSSPPAARHRRSCELLVFPRKIIIYFASGQALTSHAQFGTRRTAIWYGGGVGGRGDPREMGLNAQYSTNWVECSGEIIRKDDSSAIDLPNRTAINSPLGSSFRSALLLISGP